MRRGAAEAVIQLVPGDDALPLEEHRPIQLQPQARAIGVVILGVHAVTDNNGATSTSTATVTVTVTGVNDGPVASAISQGASEDGPAVTLTASYTDVDLGDTHTFSVDTTGTQGSVSASGGTFSYDATGAFESLARTSTRSAR
jgi:hypothetical protein